MQIFAFAVAATALLQQGESPLQPRLRAHVSPESVTVGWPFQLTLRVVAPAGSAIHFPNGPDSASNTRLLDPVSIASADSNGMMIRTAVYRMVAWDTERQPIVLEDVVVETPQGTRRLSVGNPSITVVSVLPPDSAQRIPKAARDVFPAATPWWYPWLPFTLLAIMLAAIFRWWWRRRRQEVRLPTALVVAQDAFARVEAMQLVEAGERGRFVALMVDVMRDFLRSRFPAISSAQTTAEILAAIEPLKLPAGAQIARLLEEADNTKFARAQVSAAKAIMLGAEAREVVRSVAAIPDPVPADEFGEAA